jgi:hypothetical protein
MKQQFNVRLPQRTLAIIEQHKEPDESYAEVIVRAVDCLDSQRTIEELRERLRQLESLVKPAQ